MKPLPVRHLARMRGTHMSWFSQLTHTEGLTPDWIKKAGDVIGGVIVSAVPGGTQVNNVLDLTNTRPNGPTLQEIASQTGSNIQNQLNTASQLGAVQNQTQALFAALATPMGLILALAVAAFILRKSK